MVELITVIVIVGVMAALAAPRFTSRNAFDSRGFRDQTLATLHHAQKIAIAQHRNVCATFTINSVTLTIDSDVPTDGVCNPAPAGNLISPTGGVAPYTVASQQATYAALPPALMFDALGRPRTAAGVLLAANMVIAVSDYALPITVERDTGYAR